MPAKRTAPLRAFLERRHQPAAEEIARGLAGDEIDQRPAVTAPRRRRRRVPRAIGRRGDRGAIDQQGRAGLDRDAAQARPRARPPRCAAPIVGRSARRSWPGFGDLHQHAAAPLAPQRAAARDERVGAFDRLDAEHHALLHHHGLADIERAQRARHRDAAARCRPAGRVVGHDARRARPTGASASAKEAVDADDAKSLAPRARRMTARSSPSSPSALTPMRAKNFAAAPIRAQRGERRPAAPRRPSPAPRRRSRAGCASPRRPRRAGPRHAARPRPRRDRRCPRRQARRPGGRARGRPR